MNRDGHARAFRTVQDEFLMWSSSALQAVARRKTSMTGYVRSIAILEVKIPDNDLKQNLRARLPGLERSALRRAMDSLTQILRDEKQEILQTVNNYFPETAFSI